MPPLALNYTAQLQLQHALPYLATHTWASTRRPNQCYPSCHCITGASTPVHLPLPPSLPIFTPAAGGPSGLNLLASVASSTLTRPSTEVIPPQQTIPSPAPGLHSKGPYNPAALLPSKLAKKILDLDFVEMSEITLDDPPTPSPGHPPLPARPPIHNISVWVEKFSLMAALIATRFPEKAPELFAYQASIVRAERNFDDRRWVTYDRCYRREALSTKNLDWSVPNLRLYNEAFTGHARAIPRCSFCLQEDHTSQACPRNPSRLWLGWYREPDSHFQRPSGSRTQSLECCRRYNEGKCRQTSHTCRYAHRCLECGNPHPRLHCPRSGQAGYSRPRSPISQQSQAGQPPVLPLPGRRY